MDEKLFELLTSPLKSPEEVAQLLQNLPAARSYLYEQMTMIEAKMKSLADELAEEKGKIYLQKEDLMKDQGYYMLHDEHQTIRRYYFELEEYSGNLRSVMSYQVSLIKGNI